MCVCELPAQLCVCVFSLGDAALTVAGGQPPRRDARWLEASQTLTPAPHIWPGFLPAVVRQQGLGRRSSTAPEVGQGT